MGGSVISAAIREATGVTRQKLHAMYDSLGDPGDVAEACRHTQVCSLCMSAGPLTLLNYTEMKGSRLGQVVMLSLLALTVQSSAPFQAPLGGFLGARMADM